MGAAEQEHLMRARWVIGLGLVLLLGAATPVAAQSNPLRDLWPQATAAAEGGDLEAADRRLNDLLAAGRATGVTRFPVFAESAVGLAHNAQQEGNQDLSAWAVGAATKLDPRSPEAAFGQAALARSRGDWGAMASSTLRGLRNAASVYIARQKAQVDLLIVLAISILAMTAVFALILLIRHSARVVHDLSERFSTKLSPPVAIALAWAVVFLPFFFTLGPHWLVLWWLALLFRYATRKEQIATAVLLVLTALTPALLEWAAWRTGALTSPVIRGAAASIELSYRPGTLRRLRDMVEVLGEEPRLHVLMGTLESQEGNEAQAARHYKRAMELDSGLAGAHLNLGNLHFLNNDLTAAITQYDAAAQADPSMAIAFYNHSVAAGELYRFDLQGEKLEQAKSKDRSLVNRLLEKPPAQKIVTWHMPMSDAWGLHRRLAHDPSSREFFGNYSALSNQRLWANPLTIGAMLALVLGVFMMLSGRRRGVAGSCVKCGRTFCSRCKSSHESATYCTQCIHIYLKRDGVSLDTKRRKLEEVQRWQQRTNRTRRIFGTLLPGTGQILEGSVLIGVIGLMVFLAAVAIAVLAGRLAPIATPEGPLGLTIRIGGIAIAVIAWLALAIPNWRTRAAQG